MTRTYKSDLLGLGDHVAQRLRDRLAGLTDEEYSWEPAPGCWSIRPGPDGRWRSDEAPIPPDPTPLTTIAWRLCHIIDLLNGERNATWIGTTPLPGPTDTEPPRTAEAARTAFDAAYARFRAHVEAADEARLEQPMGPIAGPYAESTGGAFVLHELDELIHHGAEIGTMRDLYRALHPADPFVAAVVSGDLPAVERHLAGEAESSPEGLPARYPAIVAQAASRQHWDVVRLLVARGFAVDVPGRPTALHLAAAAGELSVVRLLVEHGADLTRKDPTFHEAPVGWARHFGRDEVAAYLAHETAASTSAS